MFFLVVEALLWAMLVRLEHVADNISSYRALSIGLHYINTLFLVSSTLALLSVYQSRVYLSKKIRSRFS